MDFPNSIENHNFPYVLVFPMLFNSTLLLLKLLNPIALSLEGECHFILCSLVLLQR